MLTEEHDEVSIRDFVEDEPDADVPVIKHEEEQQEINLEDFFSTDTSSEDLFKEDTFASDSDLFDDSDADFDADIFSGMPDMLSNKDSDADSGDLFDDDKLSD